MPKHRPRPRSRSSTKTKTKTKTKARRRRAPSVVAPATAPATVRAAAAAKLRAAARAAKRPLSIIMRLTEVAALLNCDRRTAAQWLKGDACLLRPGGDVGPWHVRRDAFAAWCARTGVRVPALDAPEVAT